MMPVPDPSPLAQPDAAEIGRRVIIAEAQKNGWTFNEHNRDAAYLSKLASALLEERLALYAALLSAQSSLEAGKARAEKMEKLAKIVSAAGDVLLVRSRDAFNDDPHFKAARMLFTTATDNLRAALESRP